MICLLVKLPACDGKLVPLSVFYPQLPPGSQRRQSLGSRSVCSSVMLTMSFILLLFIVMLFLLLLSPVTRLPPCMFFSDVDDVVNNIVSVYCYVGLAIVVSSHWARTLYVIL